MPEKARLGYIAERATLPEIGQIADQAIDVIEKENPTLKSVLPKNYSRPELDKRRLGEIIDLFSNIDIGGNGAKEKMFLNVFMNISKGSLQKMKEKVAESFTRQKVLLVCWLR